MGGLLEEKVVIVTGGGVGIGRAAAAIFGREGQTGQALHHLPLTVNAYVKTSSS